MFDGRYRDPAPPCKLYLVEIVSYQNECGRRLSAKPASQLAMLRDILNPGRLSINCWRAGGIVAMLTCVLVSPLRAGETDPPSAEAIAFFESKVRPVLAENCYKCHGTAKQKGGLRLDSRASLATGGEQGPVVVPGHPE